MKEEVIKELISEEELQSKIEKLAKQLDIDYKDKLITVICVLKGSVFFTCDLLKKMRSNVELEFVKISSYKGNRKSFGVVKIEDGKEINVKGKEVLIVEDIVDSGHSFKFLIDYFKNKDVASLKTCTLLNKEERREVEVQIDYKVFDIPNKFIVGYGLDNNELQRNLPFVGYIEE